jgi:hypothetical protein
MRVLRRHRVRGRDGRAGASGNSNEKHRRWESLQE